jgi:hypothetical protein
MSETRHNDNYFWPGDYNVAREYTANGLKQCVCAGPMAANPTVTFAYDANGNLTADGAFV